MRTTAKVPGKINRRFGVTVHTYSYYASIPIYPFIVSFLTLSLSLQSFLFPSPSGKTTPLSNYTSSSQPFTFQLQQQPVVSKFNGPSSPPQCGRYFCGSLLNLRLHASIENSGDESKIEKGIQRDTCISLLLFLHSYNIPLFLFKFNLEPYKNSHSLNLESQNSLFEG